MKAQRSDGQPKENYLRPLGADSGSKKTGIGTAIAELVAPDLVAPPTRQTYKLWSGPNNEVVDLIEGNHPPTYQIHPAEPEFDKLTAYQKYDIVKRLIRHSAYEALPTNGEGGILSNFLGIFQFARLGLAFDMTKDVAEPRDKFLHTHGVELPVRFEVNKPDAYPHGFFSSGGVGTFRFSKGTELNQPGGALKLFVDGKPSANAVFLTGPEPEEDPNFFAKPLTNKVPAPKALPFKIVDFLFKGTAPSADRPISQLAQVNNRGDESMPSDIPEKMLLRVGDPALNFDEGSSKDFREELAERIKPGMRLFSVDLVFEDGRVERDVASVYADDHAASNEYGDRLSLYRHTRGGNSTFSRFTSWLNRLGGGDGWDGSEPGENPKA